MTERVDLEELERRTRPATSVIGARVTLPVTDLSALIAELTELRAQAGGEHVAWEYGYAQGYSDREKTDHDRADVEKSPNPYPVAAQAGGWVAARDSLPDSDVWVLVCGPEADYVVVQLEFTDDSEGRGKPYWAAEGGDLALCNYPHWMPLPNPPEATDG